MLLQTGIIPEFGAQFHQHIYSRAQDPKVYNKQLVVDMNRSVYRIVLCKNQKPSNMVNIYLDVDETGSCLISNSLGYKRFTTTRRPIKQKPCLHIKVKILREQINVSH